MGVNDVGVESVPLNSAESSRRTGFPLRDDDPRRGGSRSTGEI
jgi:hypothetical protein